jgi:hypothetical protein
MTNKLANWQATAFNQSEDSSNQIHSDEMAKTYGFKGGLVPGVTVSAYLIHPAIEAWGTDWLKHGAAKVVVEKPLYDGYDFTVDVTDADETSYQATLTDQAGTRNATGTMRLNRTATDNARRRTAGEKPTDRQCHSRRNGKATSTGDEGVTGSLE